MTDGPYVKHSRWVILAFPWSNIYYILQAFCFLSICDEYFPSDLAFSLILCFLVSFCGTAVTSSEVLSTFFREKTFFVRSRLRFSSSQLASAESHRKLLVNRCTFFTVVLQEPQSLYSSWMNDGSAIICSAKIARSSFFVLLQQSLPLLDFPTVDTIEKGVTVPKVKSATKGRSLKEMIHWRGSRPLLLFHCAKKTRSDSQLCCWQFSRPFSVVL